MSRDSTHHEGNSDATDELTFTRRAAMALLGVGTVAGVAGTAAAQGQGNGNGNGNGNTPTRKWNQHIDAQGNDLRNVGELDAETTTLGELDVESSAFDSIEAGTATLDSVITAARDADVVVWKDEEGTFHADGREEHVTSGEDFFAVAQAAVDSLTDGREHKEKVAVVSPATVGPADDLTAIELPDYTVLDVPARITVEDEGEPWVVPVTASDAEHVDVPRLTVEGNPRFSLLFSSCSNVHLGDIELHVSSFGARIDDSGSGRCKNVKVDSVYAEMGDSGIHGFETYGVDRLQVGQVMGVETGGCACLLNDTTDATVGSVVAKDPDVSGGGYAGFRVANGCSDVTCDQVVVRGGGRGIFGVSNCNDITIGEVNITETESHGALIQDCQRFTIEGGVFKNCFGEAIRVDSRTSDQHDPAEAVSISNVRIVDTRTGRDEQRQQTYGINETGPDTGNNRFVNNDLRDAGTEANISLYGDSTVVRDNLAGGVDHGTVTLSSGSDPAAVVEGVSSNRNVTLDLRAKTRDAPAASFAWDHYFEYDGGAEQWNLVVEWRTDPGEDMDLDYIVDRPQANIGESPTVEPPTFEGPITADTYRLNAVHSGLALETADSSASPGSNVQQGAWEGADYQTWEVVALEDYDDQFRIENVASGAALEVADGSTDDAANVRVGEYTGAAHQRWTIEEYRDGHYGVRAVHTGKALNVAGVSQEDGGNVVQWPYGGNGAGNELWDFESQ